MNLTFTPSAWPASDSTIIVFALTELDSVERMILHYAVTR